MRPLLPYASDISKTTTKYASKYDFSELFNLSPKQEFFGYIGTSYQRLRMNYSSVVKSKSTPFEYEIEGTTTVRKNSCKFKGVIKVVEIQEFPKMHYGVDEQHKNDGMKAQGKFIGDYLFSEEKDKKGCGEFKGKMYVIWFIDKNGKLKYDDLENYSDNYVNNQYEGTWNLYNNKKFKIANWGEYRIPNSGDLDIGAGEFSVNPKYKKKGWEDFNQ